MFAFFPYVPFGPAAAVPCPTMPAATPVHPTFFSYPTQPTPIFLHPSPAMVPTPTPSSAATASSFASFSASSSSPPSMQPSPFLLYAPSPMLPSPPVVFSASPPSAVVVPGSTSPPNHTTTLLSSSPPTAAAAAAAATTTCSRRLPYLQPSPASTSTPTTSTTSSTSPRSATATASASSSSSSSPRGEAKTTTTLMTAPIPIPMPKATSPRGGHHGPNCTCFGGGGKNPNAAEQSTTRKEQRDPAYAEKLERYRNKMRRTAPTADPQRSLQASKRKRDALGKFVKEGDGVGRRTSARIEEAVGKNEGGDEYTTAPASSSNDDRSAGVGPMHVQQDQHHQRQQQERRDGGYGATERSMAGETPDKREEEPEGERRPARGEGEESSPRTRVDFLLN